MLNHVLQYRTGLMAGLALLLAIGFSTGCGRSTISAPELEDASFRRGQNLLRESRPDEALAVFLKVIENRRDAPEANFEAARLYLDHFHDPISAIHHFNKYLEWKPDSDKAPYVRQMIETAKKEFAKSLPGEPSLGDPDRIDLQARLEALQNENEALRRQLAAKGVTAIEAFRNPRADDSRTDDAPSRASFQTAPPAVAPATAATSPEAAKPKARINFYQVQSGDTLSKISQKVYGVSSRWQDIYQANRDQLNDPASLKVGQTLKIP